MGCRVAGPALTKAWFQYSLALSKGIVQVRKEQTAAVWGMAHVTASLAVAVAEARCHVPHGVACQRQSHAQSHGTVARQVDSGLWGLEPDKEAK